MNDCLIFLEWVTDWSIEDEFFNIFHKRYCDFENISEVVEC